MMHRQHFEQLIRRVFRSQGIRGPTESEKLVQICLILFTETVVKQDWLARIKLAHLVYGDDAGDIEGRIRRNISRIRKRFNEWSAEFPTECKLEIIDNRQEPAVVRDPATGKLARGYKLSITPPATVPRPTRRSVRAKSDIHLGRYVGRAGEIASFQNLLDEIGNPKRSQRILSYYGFGGIGKTTLLGIFRDIASKQGLNIKPRFVRDQVVSESVCSWLSEQFLFDYQGSAKRPSARWRDFLDVLEPESIVLMDTTAYVDMQELNKTLATLTTIFQEERTDCLTVVATRRQPYYRVQPLELRGLSGNDIKLLGRVEGWPRDIAKHADQLAALTDGNPLLIEGICKNPALWKDFKTRKLQVTSRTKPATYLLKEMWKSLSEEAKQALSALSMLALYGAKWGFEWGSEECAALFGPGWEDLILELKEACFLHETPGNEYDIHELIVGFAFKRLQNKRAVMERLAQHFSASEKAMAATLFYTEAERC